LGVLPMELLQAAFWSLDPRRVVAKYARFADLASDSQEARRFVLLEDWANGGEPLPLPAARELMEELFGRDLPGSGRWPAGGLPDCPTLHFTAANDRIVPPATAAPGERLACPAGHVGMVVGRSAPAHLHQPLRQWLAARAHEG
jgi:polyhydroxyalkanoate synthase